MSASAHYLKTPQGETTNLLPLAHFVCMLGGDVPYFLHPTNLSSYSAKQVKSPLCLGTLQRLSRYAEELKQDFAAKNVFGAPPEDVITCASFYPGTDGQIDILLEFAHRIAEVDPKSGCVHITGYEKYDLIVPLEASQFYQH